jgi:hypothetical protein
MNQWTAFSVPTNIRSTNAESKQLGVGVRMLTKKSDGCHAERSEASQTHSDQEILHPAEAGFRMTNRFFSDSL